MKRLTAITTSLLLLAGTTAPATAQTPEERGLTIATEADARDTGWQDSSSALEMTLINRRGDETVRRMRVTSLEVGGDGDKSLVVFDNPRDVAGTAMLTFTHKVGDDDQWLYLPALRRVKRISAANKSGSFMASEFAYEDLSSEEVEKYTYTWMQDEPCPGEELSGLSCFVVERYPVDKRSGYTRQVTWIDQVDYRTVQIDYYDRKESLLKTLTMTTFEQHVGQYWRAHEMVMVNHQSGKRTRLRWESFQFQTGLDENDFTTASLRRAR
jgi:hypothetical protein